MSVSPKIYCLNNFNVCGFCSLTFYLSYPLFINKLACLILMIIERNITLIDIIFIFYVVTFNPLMNLSAFFNPLLLNKIQLNGAFFSHCKTFCILPVAIRSHSIMLSPLPLSYLKYVQL